MKSVMVDGPKSGEVLTTDSPVSEILCFAIPVALPMSWELQVDAMNSKIFPTANYRRVGRVMGSTGAIDVYEFVGMT